MPFAKAKNSSRTVTHPWPYNPHAISPKSLTGRNLLNARVEKETPSMTVAVVKLVLCAG